MAADIGGKNCVGCGVAGLIADRHRAECVDCAATVMCCPECVKSGIWPTCTVCFDTAHDDRLQTVKGMKE